MIHELKTDPAVFGSSYCGEKNFEIRKDDRNFHVDDRLRLRETEFSGEEMRQGMPLQYTGREMTVLISYILRGPAYGLADGWCIMSVIPVVAS